MKNKGISHWMSLLGPGLLYAGAAVGVSHLVMSTRAGAGYGFSLVWVVVLANVIKFPFFEAGPRYAAATGESLIHAYRKQGIIQLLIFLLFTIGTMFVVIAAVSIVTTGLASYILTSMGIETIIVGDFDLGRILWGKEYILVDDGDSFWQISTWKLSLRILLVCLLVLSIGKYKLLDKIMKVIIVLLSVTSVFALIAAFTGDFPKNPVEMKPFDWGDTAAIAAFIIPLVGWMPAPLDLAIWHSLWALEKKKANHGKLSLKDSLLDFKTGYWGTTILAVIFVGLGALIIFGSGVPIEKSGAAFAKQLIEMYASALGNWAKPVIAIAAFTTMLSTTLTCLDAFPRVLQQVSVMVFPKKSIHAWSNRIYWIWIVIIAAGAVVILANFIENMKQLVDLATMLSFITAPVLATFNIIAVHSRAMPDGMQPRPWMTWFSIAGLVFLYLFAFYYIWIRFF